MKYIKTPINWVGNKYKYLDIINKLIKDKKYKTVIDLFMGSGNVILNINIEAHSYIGNDKNKLVPYLFNAIKNIDENYTIKEFNKILSAWNYFRQKDNYYTFRTYWNKKYFANNFDKDFIYETVMLLKMCSNSMVRFNKKGEFNQGFRGLSEKKKIKGFFTENMKKLCVDGLNNIKNKLSNNSYLFYNKDFKDIILQDDMLIIADPPYILRQDMYSQDFSERHDKYLLDVLKNTKNDFIYFNYLSRDNKENKGLKKFINKENYRVIHINNKTTSGQGRKNTKIVDEVIITNIKM